MRILVLGGSLAAINAIHWIRKIDPVSEITLVTDTDFPGFIRSLLPYIVSREVKPEHAMIYPLIFLKNVERVEIIKIHDIEKIRQEKNVLNIEDTELALQEEDKILVATNVKTIEPPKNIRDKFYPLERVEDAIILSEILSASNIKNIGVVGGFYGLDIAANIAKQNYRVNLYFEENNSQVFDNDMINLLIKFLPSNLFFRKLDWSLTAQNDLIIARGHVKPSLPLLEKITIGINGGIVVDNRMRAGENIYAAGNSVEHINENMGISFIHLSDNLSIVESIVSALNIRGFFYSFKKILPLFEAKIDEKILFSLGFSSKILTEKNKNIVSARHHFYISENGEDIYIKVVGDRVTRTLYSTQVICGKGYAYGLINILNVLFNDLLIDDVIIQSSLYIPFLSRLIDPFIATCRGLWRKLLKL